MVPWVLPTCGASENITIEPEGDVEGSQFDMERILPSFRKGHKNDVLRLAPQVLKFQALSKTANFIVSFCIVNTTKIGHFQLVFLTFYNQLLRILTKSFNCTVF